MNSQFKRESAHRSARAGAESAAPPVAAPFTNDAFEFAVTQLDVGSESVHAAAALLSNEERQRADRFVFDRDRNRFIVARAGLRMLLGARLGIQPESVEFRYDPHGKPALSRALSSEDLRFNTSHSEDVAVYAFSHGRDIGVDVETVRVMPDCDEVAAHCFSILENEAYRSLDAQDKPEGFFTCWTRKEAFVKALGDGLNYSLDDFDVSLTPGEPARMLRVGNMSGDSCGWEIYGFTPLSGFVAAVVIEGSR
jgi:4'-phosphopantetheinyl transferase